MSLHLAHEVNAPLHPASGRLVAGSHHDERGMGAVLVQNGEALLLEILVDALAEAELHSVIGPRGALGLQVEAQAVGCHKGRFGRAVAVETHVVEAETLADAEDALPGGGVARREARLGEAAALHRAAQMYGFAVEQDVAARNTDLAEAEGDVDGLSVVVERHGVETRRAFAPRLRIGDANVKSPVVERDVRCPGSQIGDDATAADKGSRTQFDTSGNAVPVALRLVGDAVGILPHSDVFHAVVHAHLYPVIMPETERIGDVVLMGHTETHVAPHLTPVDQDDGLDMRTFEEERHPPALPILGDEDRAAVDGLADKMAVGCEKEGELHLSGTPVGLHEGVEIETGVVERARPLSVHGKLVADAVGEQRARQRHGALREARSKLPASGKGNLRRKGGRRQREKRGKKQAFHR